MKGSCAHCWSARMLPTYPYTCQQRAAHIDIHFQFTIRSSLQDLTMFLGKPVSEAAIQF